MKLSDFNYHLPKSRIAQDPVTPRDSSKLLVLDKTTGNMEHHIFRHLPNLIDDSYVLVFNDSHVIPARLYGKINDTKTEILLHKKKNTDTWECLVKPGRKFKEDTEITFKNLQGTVTSINEDGTRNIRFNAKGKKLDRIIEGIGHTPLPPYITKSTAKPTRYQTIYSKIKGSVAAPTAGLHFTQRILKKLQQKGIQMEFITLHIGRGTFEPVKTEKIKEHKMHTEYFEIDKATAQRLNKAKQQGKKILCVGTTSVRALESACKNGKITPQKKETDIFIYPGYKWRFVDAMITNFHLPKSTLLMLISALAGKQNIKDAYKRAILMKYRFYSFGDSMLIL